MEEQHRVLDTMGAAEILHVKPQTLANWRSLMIGPPYIKLSNRKILYKLVDLLAYLENRKITPSMEGYK